MDPEGADRAADPPDNAALAPDSAGVPLNSGIIFLTDEDLARAERQFLDRQQEEANTAEPSAPSLPDPKPVEQTSAEPRLADPRPEASKTVLQPASKARPEGIQSTVTQSTATRSEAGRPSAGVEEVLGEEISLVRSLLEWVMVLVGAIVVAMLMRSFLFQAFKIPSESMEGTLEVHDRVMVNRVSYHLHDVERGDVIVFTTPPGLPAAEAHLIKRVIGLAGETIEGRDNAVYINGYRVAESYLDPADTIFDFPPLVIPEGTVFVMGDNRDESGDSRVFGPIDTDTIVGRAFIIYWPLDRLDAI